MGQSLPIISIESFATSAPGSADYDNDAADLYAALSEIGFAIIVGHGVDDEVITGMRNAVKAVFDTPRDVLMQDMVAKGNYRGFVPLGYFTPNSGKGAADQYEAWKLHNETDPSNPVCAACSLYGPNKWPKISTDVRTPVMAYWNALTQVSERLIIALCNQMGVDQNILLGHMSNPLTNMTLLNYPPMPPQSDSWGIHPHKDFNLLTLLAHDPIGGLEVRNRNDEWLSADCPPDGMVLNVGDMLELWSGGRLLSTPHRVFNRSGKPRQSFPFFSKPRWDVTVKPLLEPIAGFDRPPLHVGTSAADIWYSNWPDTVSTDPAQVLGHYK
jgi:isopenicillin N synthase-like dioxygenase